MKKSLFALAAMGAFAGAAHAQSSVTVYGLIDMGYTNITTDSTLRSSGATTNSTATQTGNNGRMSGSRLGFRGVEDLGGGTTAGFTLEFGPDFTEQVNGIQGGTRLGFLSLSNKQAGGLHVGRQVSSTKLVNDVFTAFGNANFSTGNVAGAGLSTSSVSQSSGIYTAVNNASTQGALGNANGGERISNLIRYTTPSLVPGLSASAALYKTATSDKTTQAGIIGDANGEGTDFGIRYTLGAFDAMAAYSVYNTTNGTTTDFTHKNTVMSLGASYDAKVVKAFVAYNKRDFEISTTANSQIKFTDLTVGLNAPVGNANLLVAYSSGNDDSTVQKTDKSGFQVGAVYNLSKRTNVYAVYGSGKAESTTTGTSANSKFADTGTAIGIRHTF
jgi:predicted porin